MDVYVVSKIWNDRGEGVVLGAGASMEDASTVADRFPADPFTWGEWISDPGSGVRSKRWVRRDGVREGGQEIVCVPLAGYTGSLLAEGLTTEGLTADLRRVRGTDLVRLGYVAPPWAEEMINISSWAAVAARAANAAAGATREALVDAIRLVDEAWTRNREAGVRADEIRIGTGPAKRYLERMAERFSSAARGTLLTDTSIMGLPIVIDPAMPPELIRIGGVAYLIDVPEPGQMLRLGDEVVRILDTYGLLTNPPG